MKKAFYIWLSVITVLLSSTIFKTNVFAAPQVSINEPKVPLVNNASDFDMLFTVGLTEGEFSKNSVTYTVMVNNKDYDSGSATKIDKVNQEFTYAIPLASSKLNANDTVKIVLTARYRTSSVTKAVTFTILDKNQYSKIDIYGKSNMEHDFSKNGSLNYEFDVKALNNNNEKFDIADATVQYGNNKNIAIEKYAKYSATLTSDMTGNIKFDLINSNIPSNTHTLKLENIKEKVPVQFSFAFDKLYVPLGEQQRIHFDLSPKDYLETSIIWSSSNTKAVAVNNGYLIGVAPGKSTITAIVDGKEYSVVAECYSSISKILIEGDENEEMVMEMGEERKVQYDLFPYDVKPQGSVIFKSSNPFVFTVSTDGTVYAKSSGDAELTIEVDGITAKRKVKVIEAIKSVEIRPNEIHLLVGKVASLNPVVFPESSAKYCNGAWASDNPSVAGMENGKLVTRTPGEATITYRCRYKTTKAKVYVTEYQSDFKLNTNRVEILNGEQYDLTKLYTLVSEEEIDIKFEIKDAVYGKIEGNLFKATAIGRVDVEVYTSNQRETVSFVIQQKPLEESEQYFLLNKEYIMESSLDDVRQVKFYNDAFEGNEQKLMLIYNDALFTESGKIIYDFSEVTTPEAKDLKITLKNRTMILSAYAGKKLEIEFDYKKGKEYYQKISVEFNGQYFAPLSIPAKITSNNITITEFKHSVSEQPGTRVYWITNEGKVLDRSVVLDGKIVIEKEQDEMAAIFKSVNNAIIKTEHEIQKENNGGILVPVISIFSAIFVITIAGIIIIVKKL